MQKTISLYLIIVGLLALPASAAQVWISEGHVDLAWAYSAGKWSAVVNDENLFPPVSVPPGQAVLVGKDKPFPEEGSRLLRPDDERWDFTGAEAGEPIWLLPASNAGNPLVEPGFDTGGIPVAVAKSPVRIDLLAVEHGGGGEFGMFTPMNSIHMATFDGIDESDFYLMGAGSHAHMIWTFSKKGLYRITFRASMLLVAGDEASRSYSEPETFNFAIGLDGMERWLLRNGVDPALWGVNDSPAGDGVPNLMKYALGLPPLIPAAGVTGSFGFIEKDDDRHLALSFSLNPDAEDISTRIEVSEDLENWHHGEGQTVVISQTASSLHVRDALSLAPGQPRRFLRLAVERDAPTEYDDDF